MDITPNDVKKHFYYNDKSGSFTNTKLSSYNFFGDYTQEQLIWVYMTGNLVDKVGFIDGNKRNFRWNNLSIAPSVLHAETCLVTLIYPDGKIELNIYDLSITMINHGVVTKKTNFTNKKQVALALKSMCEQLRCELDRM